MRRDEMPRKNARPAQKKARARLKAAMAAPKKPRRMTARPIPEPPLMGLAMVAAAASLLSRDDRMRRDENG
jgi:hypothetical protein